MAYTKGHKKVKKVMGEYKRGTLKSSSGRKVTKKSQAVAIALSEARAAGARIPKKKNNPHGKRGKKKSYARKMYYDYE